MGEADDRRSKLEAAILAFRAENARDPHRVFDSGVQRPKELLDAERLARWVERLEPAPSEALTLASHCQHLCRWELPRTDFPEGRIGYLTWRKALARMHADRAAEILRRVGYEDEALISAVRAINLKQGLHTNAETQTMEDALCLTFLQFELDEFADKHDDDKVVDIIRKTWNKMSARGQEAARALVPSLPKRAAALIHRALTPT